MRQKGARYMTDKMIHEERKNTSQVTRAKICSMHDGNKT
jgi:hypothetical protein